MITEKLAKAQIARLSGMMGFPRENPPAIRELMGALMVCQQDSVAIGIIDDILESFQRCPAPADLRRTAYDRQERNEGPKRRCSICGGGGFTTVFQIVRWKGQSFVATSIKTIPGVTTQEEADAFQRRVMATGSEDEVRSAAVPCVCLPATHHALTGEHR